MVRKFYLALVISVACCNLYSGNRFANSRLLSICERIGLNKENLELGCNNENDSTWRFNGHMLRVGTNYLGDISYIGYKLFDFDRDSVCRIAPVLHFLERFSLEWDLAKGQDEKTKMISQSKISFSKGDAGLLKFISPGDNLTIVENARKEFIVSSDSQKGKIEVHIPVDYQVISGANSIELENMAERDLPRNDESLIGYQIPEWWKNADLSVSGEHVIASNGTYLSSVIRSDIYLKRTGDELYVDTNADNTTRCINNILLTGCFSRTIPVDLKIDKYGFEKSDLKVSWQQIIRFLENDGCLPYLGIKSKDNDRVTATLFAINVEMAYNHMVVIDFPLSIILHGNGRIKAKLVSYTPLQGVVDTFFKTGYPQR